MIIEQNMKYYIIEDTTAMISRYNSHILVKAINKKEALDKMWVILGYDNQKMIFQQDISHIIKKNLM